MKKLIGNMELRSSETLFFFFSLCFVSFLTTFALLINKSSWFRPRRIRKALKSQGIDGPPPSFLYGNLSEIKRATLEAKKKEQRDQEKEEDQSMSRDYASTLFPYLHHWRKTYGPVFVFWIGRRAAIHVSRQELVREIGLRVSLELGKGTHLQKIQEPLFGHGILKSNGLEWAHQRKIIAPQFFMDKVKGMVGLMVESGTPLLKSWEDRIQKQGDTAEITVDEDLRSFSADVISRACFGSSYSKGKEIFTKLRSLSKLISTRRILFEVPYIRFLPTRSNREIRRLEREIRSLILDVVGERNNNPASEEDLLRSILENAGIGTEKKNGVGSDDAVDRFVVDNCKNIYFAGHETTAVTATWCLLLLAKHPEWQHRARHEVVQLCKGQPPNSHTIHEMKMLTMVIQETLRLYPPTPFVVRETFEDMRIGDFQLPRGVELWVPTSTMHHDPSLWGPDADEFNPQRFARGISAACKYPHAYIPFGFGARTCVGQNFAMVELKIVLSLLLSRFSFSLSPKYVHSPAFRLIIEPEFGLHLLVKKV